MIISSTVDVAALAAELRRSAARKGGRLILGIAGAPGSGKSTLAQLLAAELADDGGAVVPMDGFHLANRLLDGTPLRDRKGAIDTFDGWGYVSLLRRLAARDEPVVFAPAYRRGLEEPIAGSIAIAQEADFIITEGNYLLADGEPWSRIRDLLDDVWFVQTARELRLQRLVERHVTFGMERAAAKKWAAGPDEANARLVESTRFRAGRVVQWN